MIPELTGLGEQFGLGVALVPLAFAALVTGIVFAAQSLAQWFNDRNP
jgi:hypothetical protein